MKNAKLLVLFGFMAFIPWGLLLQPAGIKIQITGLFIQLVGASLIVIKRKQIF